MNNQTRKVNDYFQSEMISIQVDERFDGFGNSASWFSGIIAEDETYKPIISIRNIIELS